MTWPGNLRPEHGLLLMVNGEPRRLRALSIASGPNQLPVWLADVDGHIGGAGTLESAILLATRATQRTPEVSP